MLALTAPIQNDFEDGTTQGWGPFGSPTVANSTEAAFTGARSLKTTNRTATFMGPSINLLPNQLTPGANHRVSVAVRLVAGEAPTTARVTVSARCLGARTVRTVGQHRLTDAAGLTLTGTTRLRSRSPGSLTSRAFDDRFLLRRRVSVDRDGAPAPLAHGFEDGTPQGWIPEAAAVTIEKHHRSCSAGPAA